MSDEWFESWVFAEHRCVRRGGEHACEALSLHGYRGKNALHAAIRDVLTERSAYALRRGHG